MFYEKKNSTNLTNIFVDLIVGQSNTVKDIKKLIQVKLERLEKDEKTGRKRKISW